MSGKSLVIRVMQKKEQKQFNKLAGKFHYMGEGHSGGDTMRLIVEADGEWVALLLWGSAAYRLKDRDIFIGWSAPQQAQRQKLIVQNRRFVLLSKPGTHPNLASRILGKMIKELPALWHKKFGYEPLMAETFSDIETQAGTCYKASGWIGLGKTKGYSKASKKSTIWHEDSGYPVHKAHVINGSIVWRKETGGRLFTMIECQ